MPHAEDRCDTPKHDRRESIVTVRGKRMCAECWQAHCGKPPEQPYDATLLPEGLRARTKPYVPS